MMRESPFPSVPIAGVRTSFPDADINIDYFVSEDADVCLMHDRPFSKALSWIEYDLKTNQLQIIMEDGDIRDFGMAVSPILQPYFQNTQFVHVIQLNTIDKCPVASIEIPLIIHHP
jgi:hypothetical protein